MNNINIKDHIRTIADFPKKEFCFMIYALF